MDRATSIELAAGHRREQTLLDIDQYVIVEVFDSPYAIPLQAVVEVEQIPPLAPIPHASPWVRGVVNLRGSVLTLVDLSGLLGLGRWRESGAARMLVVDREDPVAIAVDGLRGMRRLANQVDTAIADHLPGGVSRYCLGLYREGGEYIPALDIPALLRDSESGRSPTSEGRRASGFSRSLPDSNGRP